MKRIDHKNGVSVMGLGPNRPITFTAIKLQRYGDETVASAKVENADGMAISAPTYPWSCQSGKPVY